MQDGVRQHPLKAALCLGTTVFNVVQFKSMLTSWGLLRPSVGSGKNNAVIKKDVVTVLAHHLFKNDGLSEERIAEIIAVQCGQRTCRNVEEASDLIHAVSCLDPSLQEEFAPLVKDCVNQLEIQHQEELARLKPTDKKAGQEKKSEEKKHETKKPEQPDDEKEQSEDVPMKEAEAPLKPSLDVAMEELPPRQVRQEPESRRPREKGRQRLATPQILKDLLPDIESLYLNWMPENRMARADFQGWKVTCRILQFCQCNKHSLKRYISHLAGCAS